MSDRYFIHLISCTLNGTQPDPIPDGVTRFTIYPTAERQRLLHTVYEKALQAGLLGEDECSKKWKDDWVRNRVRDVRQFAEAEEIIALFANNGIRIMPLKGMLLKQLYPESYMRRMVDLDFLIDAENIDSVKQIMLADAYTHCVDGEVHTCFKKPPCFWIEFHRGRLFADDSNNMYFTDIWKRAAQKSGQSEFYEMSARDLCLHTILHYAKHFDNGGIGIRAVMDWYVLKKNYGDVIAKNDFQKLLDDTGTKQFVSVLNRMSEIWFSGQPQVADLSLIEEYLIASSTYGSRDGTEIRTAARLCSNPQNKRIRIVFVFKRIFPGLSMMKKRYAFVKKMPVLLPLGWLARILSLFFSKDKNAIQYIKSLKAVTPEAVMKDKRIFEEFRINKD